MGWNQWQNEVAPLSSAQAQHSLGDLVGLRRVIDPRVVLQVRELQALLLEVLISDGALEDILTVADRKRRLRRRGEEQDRGSSALGSSGQNASAPR
jgi:hypothetical protein